MLRLGWLVAGVLPLVMPPAAVAQVCPGVTLAGELLAPLGVVQTTQGNLVVSESGTLVSHTGRISIVSPAGGRRTLLDGLPSGINDVGEPSGPAGLAMRGRTLYVLMGVGDSVLPGPVPTRHLPNPGVSSPIFSSVLAMHFSAAVEETTAGFILSLADQQSLADGRRVLLSNGRGDTITIELVTDFPDHLPDPLPGFPQLVRGTNPFALAIENDRLHVTDGGQNLVWTVDARSGEHWPLTRFDTIPNPLPIGGPVVEAVPTGIALVHGQLLVTLFRGVPFPPGTSTVVQVDPDTGEQALLIQGLKTAIAVAALEPSRRTDYLVLQHSSGAGPFFPGPGLLLRFPAAGGAPALLANCLARPTSMFYDPRSTTVFVTELQTGRLVALSLGGS